MNKTLMTAFSLGLLAHGIASAETSPWSMRVGPTHVRFSTSADVSINGDTVPGGSARASSNNTLGLEIGYAINPDWTARLLVGAPPTTTVTGTGTLSGAGTLGEVQYGPLVLSATYNLPAAGGLRPYVGAGINYTIVFSSRDGSLSNLSVDNAWGKVLQLGVETDLNRDWTLGLDVRKIFLKTHARGQVGPGGPNAHARVTLNPAVVMFSLGRRF